jgi:hypothetical protein
VTEPRPVDAPRPTADAAPTGRPSARGLPVRRVVRRVRLRGEPGALVATDADGREVRTVVGADGVVSAVHVGGPLFADVAPDSLGAVDLLRADGARHARLDLRDWVPEAAELTDAQEALHRSELTEVLERAGLALRPVAPSQLAEAIDATDLPALVPLSARLPPGYTVVRSLAVAVSFVSVGLGLTTDVAQGGLVLGACALLLASTLWAAALWARALRDDRLPDDGAPTLGPHPDATVTRRFLRTARLRIARDDVVVVDGLGRERRLPRSGPHAVIAAAVVREGTPTAQVELQTADGTGRATLPWELWCAGDGGDQALEAVCRDGGLELVRGAAPSRRPSAQEQRARAAYAPPDPRLVADVRSYPAGLPGQAASVQTTAFALLLLLVTALVPDVPAAAAPMAVLTLLLSAGAPVLRLLRRRLWLDRSA